MLKNAIFAVSDTLKVWQEMDIQKLKAFVTVVEERNISKAALRLNMQQPPLTRLIKQLEQQLEAQLLIRLPRGVEVTEAGQVLYQEALSILAHTQLISQRVHNIAQGLAGQINIGFTNSVSLHAFLPALLREFREAYPKVSIHLEEEGSRALSDAVSNQKLDVAFLRKPASADSGLKSLHLLDEDLIVALPSNHRLAKGPEAIELSALQAEDFVLYRRLLGQDLFDTIMAICYRAEFSPHIVQESPRLTSSLNLISAGIGLSIVPASIRDFWNRQVVYKSIISEPACRAPIYAIYRPDQDNIRLQHLLSCLGALEYA